MAAHAPVYETGEQGQLRYKYEEGWCLMFPAYIHDFNRENFCLKNV
jgi:hypothetical protein